MLKEICHTVTLSGTGETKEMAFNHIFSQIKPLISRTFSQVIIQIEPQEAEILSATETVSTERFLGVLFPREKIRYQVDLRIQLRLKTIDLAQIPFEQRVETLSPLQRALQLR